MNTAQLDMILGGLEAGPDVTSDMCEAGARVYEEMVLAKIFNDHEIVEAIYIAMWHKANPAK